MGEHSQCEPSDPSAQAEEFGVGIGVAVAIGIESDCDTDCDPDSDPDLLRTWAQLDSVGEIAGPGDSSLASRRNGRAFSSRAARGGGLP